MANHFEEVLQMIRGKNINLVESTAYWDFWSAEYKTPREIVHANYLYLKTKCPLKEATESKLRLWKKLSDYKTYEIVIPPRSSFASLPEQTRKQFNGDKIWTTRQLIEENLFADLELREIVGIEPNFIDPDLEVNSGETYDATSYLTKWISTSSNVSEKSNSIGILRANPGVGKTTLARIIAYEISNKFKNTIPILVETELWRPHLQTEIQLETIWKIAISARFSDVSQLNQVAFRVLIREGIFPIIFDGFDELCLNPLSIYTPPGLIQDFQDTLDSDEAPGNAKILLTTRETFWQSFCDELDTENMDLFRLRSFSNEKRKQYFNKRLENPAERDTALRIAKQISGKLYDDINIEHKNMDRPSGVPFILDMIASYIKDNTEPEINPYGTDPLAPLIEAVCRRENIRQNLNITYEKQIELFEELFRDHPETIAYEDVKLYLDVYCNVTDNAVVDRFLNHFFLVRKDKKEFLPRYEVLKIYFVARFLANGLIDEKRNIDRKKLCSLLSKSSAGNTQILDWLVSQLLNIDQQSLLKAVHHALKIINDPSNTSERSKAGMAIYSVVVRLIKEKIDKKSRVKRLAEYLNADIQGNMLIFNKSIFAGRMQSFDFSNCQILDCELNNIEFKNCIFNASTIFKQCEFEGTLKFTNCKDAQLLKEEKNNYSKEATYCIDQLLQKSTTPEVLKYFAEDSLYKALKKLKGQFGYASIMYNHRLKGLPQSNPFTDLVWDALIRKEIVVKHEMSKFSDVGLHLTEDHHIRKEVVTFLDNGYLGTNLKSVLKYMIEKK